MAEIDRRRFLTFLVAGPTLTVAAQLLGELPAQAAVVPSPPEPTDTMDLGDYLILAAKPYSNMISLTFTPDGVAHFLMPRQEVGQGLDTAMAMLIAEELGVPLAKVSVGLLDATPALQFNQLTGSSNSVRALYDPVRQMAAAAKGTMTSAASLHLAEPEHHLTTSDGVWRARDGRSVDLGTLATLAAVSTTRQVAAAAPKDPSTFTLVGTPQTRQDARDIVTGRKKYTMDLDVPGAVPTYVRRSPTLGGTPVSCSNLDAVRQMTGVKGVVKIASGYAVAARTFGEALTAANALQVVWTKGTVDDQSDDTVLAQLKAAVVPQAPAPPGSWSGQFSWAFVSHAALETNDAVADVQKTSATVWAPFKTPIVAQSMIASLIGLDVSKVTVHCIGAGGSFGRHLFFDAPLEAAQASQLLGFPVRLKWTRTDDMRHGRMHPASFHSLQASIVGGSITAYQQNVASVQTDLKHGLGDAMSAGGVQTDQGNQSVSQSLFNTTVSTPYNFGKNGHTLQEILLQVPTASFRSVYSYSVRASEEIMVDELAAMMKVDPLAFRLTYLKDARQAAVLKKVAADGEWGRTLPAGHAQGIAYHEEYRSLTACLVEIDATDPTRPRVTKARIAVDAGTPINPRGLQAQMLGGLSDAIGVVLQAGLHLQTGGIAEASYSEFHYTRMKNYPPDVDVYVFPPTGNPPGGAGELGLPAAAGAIANAYARATGTKPRTFPINFPVDFTVRPRSVSPEPPYKA